MVDIDIATDVGSGMTRDIDDDVGSTDVRQ